MPTYDFECSSCEVRWEEFLFRIGAMAKKCPSCGGAKLEKIWASRALPQRDSAKSAFPYITKHITGSPIEIKSARHLEQVCKQNGVTHRPDAAFIDKRYEGLDWKTGEQKYSEGSGAGFPGSWV